MRLASFVLASSTTLGCYSPSIAPCQYACAGTTCPDGLTCNSQGMCAAAADDMCTAPQGDAATDGAPDDVQVPCAWPLTSNIDACAQGIASATLDLTIGEGSTGQVNTADLSSTIPSLGAEVADQLTPGHPVALLKLRSLTIETGAVFEVTGARPLLVLVDGDVTIAGTIRLTASATTSCGGNAAAGSASNFPLGGPGGGGGGSYGNNNSNMGGERGGSGGFDEDSNPGGAGGLAGLVIGATSTLVPLSPGCPGGRGGGGGGLGGNGGGSIQISSRTSITITATGSIAAGGGGGDHGIAGVSAGTRFRNGGGGGGAGGGILLEAPSLAVDVARLCVNGGGGGGGGGIEPNQTGVAATAGEHGCTAGFSTQAAGGDGGGVSTTVTGGRGGIGATRAGNAGIGLGGSDALGGGETGFGGGGGGGGVGWTRLIETTAASSADILGQR